MRDSNNMHAVCLNSYPPIKYMNDTSHDIVNLVHEYNELQTNQGKEHLQVTH